MYLWSFTNWASLMFLGLALSSFFLRNPPSPPRNTAEETPKSIYNFAIKIDVIIHAACTLIPCPTSPFVCSNTYTLRLTKRQTISDFSREKLLQKEVEVTEEEERINLDEIREDAGVDDSEEEVDEDDDDCDGEEDATQVLRYSGGPLFVPMDDKEDDDGDRDSDDDDDKDSDEEVEEEWILL